MNAASAAIDSPTEQQPQELTTTVKPRLEFNKRYPLLFNPCNEEINLVTLEYMFKPIILLDPSQRGTVIVSKDTNEVNVELLNKSEGSELFKGSLQKTSSISGSLEKTDCILRLTRDGKAFQLQQVESSVVNLRHVRDERQFSSNQSFDVNQSRTLVARQLNAMTGKKRKAPTSTSTPAPASMSAPAPAPAPPTLANETD